MEVENGRSIAVLVADDHTILRRGLMDIINQEVDMRVVAEASDGPEAVRLYNEYRPDVALIDLAMPGLGGVEVIRMIKASHPSARLIILTTYDTDEDIELGFKAGAQAYLLKDLTSEDLVERIRDVMRGRKRVALAIAEKLADRVSHAVEAMASADEHSWRKAFNAFTATSYFDFPVTSTEKMPSLFAS
jgi:two-component system, NarL family, response regulator